MKAAVVKWLMLACCIFAAASAAQDNVLRFLNHKEVVRMAQQKHSDDMKAVFSGGYKGDLPMEKFRAKSIVCPSGITQCPDSSTCCPLSNGQYGCCEGVDAVCCKDGVHCCPKGFKCDEEHGRCTSEIRGISFHWVDNKVLRAEPLPHIAPNNTCRDNKTKCLPNDVCCSARNNTFGCCPLPKGVCCLDLLHCCPMGTKCDVQRRRCFRGEGDWEVPWVERRPPKPEPSREVIEAPSSKAVSKIQAVTCKDGLLCPDGSTCCLLKNGSYGCCSFPDKEQTPVSESVRSVVCPGGKDECPDGNTCCRQASGAWGCCPLPNAVCCSDLVHCCPSGYTCDTGTGRCEQSDGQHSVPWSVKTPAVPSSVRTVVCPGGTAECPDGNTCCKEASGAWGCCPLPNAVCCSDHTHCCPSGYTCGTSNCTQSDGRHSVLWSVKTPAVPSSVRTVVCPGGEQQCPDGNTCCILASGQYGCCPLPNAVCCSDKVHCCPNGYTCDTHSCKQSDGQHSVPWSVKTPAVPREGVERVKCLNGGYCSDGNTCCPLADGSYGCCPYPQAVCCSDKLHCCPHGFTCDLAIKSCKNSTTSIPWQEKKPAVSNVQTVICPDKSECPDGSTCCETSSGYGCCPYKNAMCCSDEIHCCPQGTTCDVAQSTCKQGQDLIPWEEKTPSLQRVRSVICPDGQSECSDGQTCCIETSGSYGCCPLPDAVCCSDHIHCCPEGTTCNLAQSTCQRGQDLIPWEEKTPSLQRVRSVVCPGGKSECPEGQTCCVQMSGSYGCCPLPDAVCCSDHQHCCPQGYTCNLKTLSCDQGLTTVPWVKKRSALPSLP